jgi:succinyl-CoA synthetase beta subunit
MKLYEYQAKQLFAQYGVPTVESDVARNPEDAAEVARRIGGRVVVKAQLLLGGRGKAGGIRPTDSPEEAADAAGELLSMRIKSTPVKSVLIAKAVDILKEFYVSFTIDRTRKMIVLITSAEGGVDIEELAAHSPEKIHLLEVDPNAGIGEKGLEGFLGRVFTEKRTRGQALDTVSRMYRLFIEKDCSLVEINPFALTSAGTLLALDAKIIVDDNSLFKHPEMEAMRNDEEYSSDELEAKQHGLSFVGLEGNIGCIVNGAGLAMATMDLIKLLGGSPANFLDVGGSSSPDKVVHAFDILTRNMKIRAVLINIFGGITRCDDIARGILRAKDKMNIRFPLVIRLIGTNEKEGRRILQEAGIAAHEDLVSAVKEVVKYA